MPDSETKASGGGDASISVGKKKDDSSESTDPISGLKNPRGSRKVGYGAVTSQKGVRKRKDGTANKMSFDVDELEEGLFVQVEDEEEVEEVVEYEEIPEAELAAAQQEEAEKEGAKGEKTTKDVTKAEDSAGYKIRPDLTQKFRPGTVQLIIERAIKDKLEGKDYSLEESEEWVKQILEDVHEKVKKEDYKRYKIISQITMGERRGEGASSSSRCLWDAEADCMATYTFLNDSIFCNGTVYGIYFY